jgi:hypothetical protein
MHLDKFINSYIGKYVMSILLGFGLATFFRVVCKGKNCKIISAPPMDEINDQIYQFNDKCYKMEKTPVKCNNNKNIIPIA